MVSTASLDDLRGVAQIGFADLRIAPPPPALPGQRKPRRRPISSSRSGLDGSRYDPGCRPGAMSARSSLHVSAGRRGTVRGVEPSVGTEPGPGIGPRGASGIERVGRRHDNHSVRGIFLTGRGLGAAGERVMSSGSGQDATRPGPGREALAAGMPETSLPSRCEQKNFLAIGIACATFERHTRQKLTHKSYPRIRRTI